MEIKKPNIKMPTDLISGEGFLSGLQAATFLLYPHMGIREGKGERTLDIWSLGLYYRGCIVSSSELTDCIVRLIKLHPKSHICNYQHHRKLGFSF